ncbi:S8 family serine peptidase [Candidatus Peregrinibacteria bacterium]|nr:S8 family serine peptidase [Candidatus Peregrinibacteria bacterium]MBI4129456.1 S8 family serine peptidase [Candidatus Peregrinibacteria bacterium]
MPKFHISLRTVSVPVLLAVLLSWASPVLAGPHNGKEVPGRYIVLLKEGADADTVARRHGLVVEHRYEKVVHGFSAGGGLGKFQALKDDSDIALVEPDRIVEAFGQTLPTGVSRIDADLSPTAKINGTDERVDADIAIIDTGIQGNHPDLNVVGGYNCTSGNTGKWNDGNGHGTHVAGTAAAKDDGNGVVGVAPGARLWAVKVLNNNGSGFLSWVICGVDWVTNHAGTIDVANMSLGGEFVSTALNDALAKSVAAGVTYAVAAGNSNKDAASFSPANHPDVLAVSALADSDGRCGALGPVTSYGADDTRATFSNYGPVVDIAAPGVSILSTYKGSSYAKLSGTSMASPHVAGSAALYVASHGRDVNADGIVNGADVYALQSALVGGGVSQTQICDTSLADGFGGFTGDPDSFPEPMVYTKSF